MRMLVAVTVALFASLMSPFQLEASEAEGISIHIQTSLKEEAEMDLRLILEGQSPPLWMGTGVWGEAHKEDGHGSVLVGPYWNLLTYGHDAKIKAGVAVGTGSAHSKDSHERESALLLAGFLSAGNEEEGLSALFHYQRGGDENQVRAVINWRASDSLSLGAIHQTGDGTGPRLMVPLADPARAWAALDSVKIWAAPMFGGECKALFGVHLGFE